MMDYFISTLAMFQRILDITVLENTVWLKKKGLTVAGLSP